jgi:hypothetical protein
LKEALFPWQGERMIVIFSDRVFRLIHLPSFVRRDKRENYLSPQTKKGWGIIPHPVVHIPLKTAISAV